MTESLQASQCIGITEFRIENDGPFELRYEPALTWNPEFGGKSCMYRCNRNHFIHRNGEGTEKEVNFFYIRSVCTTFVICQRYSVELSCSS